MSSLSTSSTILSFWVLLTGIFVFFQPCVPLSPGLQDILTLKHTVHAISVSGPFFCEKQLLLTRQHWSHGTGGGVVSITAS